MPLTSAYRERTVNDLVLLFKHGQINLEPGFQRKSVWSDSDRRRLIQSITSNYPLPSVFLYQRSHRSGFIYDVIDGKQRLESILMFLGIGRFKRDAFEVPLEVGRDRDWWDWRGLRAQHKEIAAKLQGYTIQTVEVDGTFPEIVDLFVRLNSTGKRLTGAEKRHAKFYDSPFLQQAERQVRRHHRFLTGQRVLSTSQLARMKGTELLCELLLSLERGGPINKKTALDRAMGNGSIDGRTLGRIVRELGRTLGLMRRMFPDLRQTRFRNTAEFYSLFMLVWEMDQDGMIVGDKKRSRQAFAILKDLSSGVDRLRDSYRHAKAVKPQPPYSDYLLTVQGDTDSFATRQRRARILRTLLESIFQRKDGRRGFSVEQRRILWNDEQRRKCADCGERLTWSNFTVDHVKAHSRGGSTRLENARILCKSCNSSKGAR
jgi:hypothetical protein